MAQGSREQVAHRRTEGGSEKWLHQGLGSGTAVRWGPFVPGRLVGGDTQACEMHIKEVTSIAISQRI